MRTGADGPEFRRYIDWLLVYAQIGVVLSRPVQVSGAPLVVNGREIPSVDEVASALQGAGEGHLVRVLEV